MSQTKILKPHGLPLANKRPAAANCFILLRQGYGGHAGSNPTPQGALFMSLLQSAARRAATTPKAASRRNQKSLCNVWKIFALKKNYD
ncbi:MAG: hypothetical protein PHO37_12530 [Kiritimatiellae bacterium]|nr:hypothetical protein [Kiritimatiellia bacterium]